MEVLPKDINVTWLLPHRSFPTTGRRRVAPAEVAGAIVYKLKTGYQWRWLPVAALFGGKRSVGKVSTTTSPPGVSQGSGNSCGARDCACIVACSTCLAPSSPAAIQGGAAVGYQARKATRSTIALLLADNRGQPLVLATPQAGQHLDTLQLAEVFAELCTLLEEAGLRLDGLFFNADQAFDVSSLRQACARHDMQDNMPRRRAADWKTNDETPYSTLNSIVVLSSRT